MKEAGKLSQRDAVEAWRDSCKRRGDANATIDIGQVLSHAHNTTVLSCSTAILYGTFNHFSVLYAVLLVRLKIKPLAELLFAIDGSERFATGLSLTSSYFSKLY